MKAEDITGDMPRFMLSMQLADLAHQMFGETWIQPTQLDEDSHALIQQMHQVGLIDMAMSLEDGKQIVIYRLA